MQNLLRKSIELPGCLEKSNVSLAVKFLRIYKRQMLLINETTSLSLLSFVSVSLKEIIFGYTRAKKLALQDEVARVVIIHSSVNGLFRGEFRKNIVATVGYNILPVISNIGRLSRYRIVEI